MTILPFIIVVALAPQSAPPAASQPATQPLRMLPNRPDARNVLRIPPTIAESDLVIYDYFLELAAPQRAFLDQAYARYREAISADLDKAWPELDELNAMATAERRNGMGFGLASAMDHFYDKQDAIERQIARADHALFAELESVLSPAQMEQMPRVRDHRLRQCCSNQLFRLNRPSQVDLSAWVREVVTDQDVWRGLEPLLADYERRLTPLTVSLERELRNQDRALLHLWAWARRDENDQPLAAAEQTARSETSAQRQFAILEQGAGLQAEIAVLNFQYLPQLTSRLPLERGTALARRFQTFVYPQVYLVFDINALDVCDEIIKLTSLDAAQIEAVKAIRESYIAAYKALYEEMESACDEWMAHYARSRATTDKFEPFRIKMRACREQRWDATLRVIGQMESIVPRGLSAEVDEALQRIRSLIVQFKREAPNDRYPTQ